LCEIGICTGSDQRGKNDLVIIIYSQCLLIKIHCDPAAIADLCIRSRLHDVHHSDIALFHPFSQPDHVPGGFIFFHLVVHLHDLFTVQGLMDGFGLIAGFFPRIVCIQNPAEGIGRGLGKL